MGCVASRSRSLYYKLYYWWNDDTLSSPFLMTESRLEELQCMMCGGQGMEPCKRCSGQGMMAEITDNGSYFIFDCERCSGQGELPCYCTQSPSM